MGFLDTGSVPDLSNPGELANAFNSSFQNGFRDPFPELTAAGSFESHFTKQTQVNDSLISGGVPVT